MRTLTTLANAGLNVIRAYERPNACTPTISCALESRFSRFDQVQAQSVRKRPLTKSSARNSAANQLILSLVCRANIAQLPKSRPKASAKCAPTDEGSN